jgi:peroxiredoxin
MNELKPGEAIKDFTLYDQNLNEVHLYDLKGKKVLLAFHPLAWTRGCAKHMQLLEDNFERFRAANAVVLGISIDSVHSKKAWARELGIANTLFLADFWPHGQVARMYGMFDEDMGVSERASIVVDENMRIRFVKVYETRSLPDIEEIFDAMA